MQLADEAVFESALAEDIKQIHKDGMACGILAVDLKQDPQTDSYASALAHVAEKLLAVKAHERITLFSKDQRLFVLVHGLGYDVIDSYLNLTEYALLADLEIQSCSDEGLFKDIQISKMGVQLLDDHFESPDSVMHAVSDLMQKMHN